MPVKMVSDVQAATLHDCHAVAALPGRSAVAGDAVLRCQRLALDDELALVRLPPAVAPHASELEFWLQVEQVADPRDETPWRLSVALCQRLDTAP